jgi:cytochrome b6-f complex iron-sulfur subunit
MGRKFLTILESPRAVSRDSPTKTPVLVAIRRGHRPCYALSRRLLTMSDQAERTCTQSRRDFCVSACHAATAVALGSVLQSCGGGGGNPAGPGGGTAAPALPVVNGTAAGGMVTVAVDAASPLAVVGGAALVRSSGGDMLVARTAQDTFSALTAICTHEACTITGFRSPSYVCPCHGSQYSTSGAVLNGPATRSLRTFPSQFAGSTLTITL